MAKVKSFSYYERTKTIPGPRLGLLGCASSEFAFDSLCRHLFVPLYLALFLSALPSLRPFIIVSPGEPAGPEW